MGRYGHLHRHPRVSKVADCELLAGYGGTGSALDGDCQIIPDNYEGVILTLVYCLAFGEVEFCLQFEVGLDTFKLLSWQITPDNRPPSILAASKIYFSRIPILNDEIMKKYIFTLAAGLLLVTSAFSYFPTGNTEMIKKETVTALTRSTNLSPFLDNPIAMSIEGLGQVDA